MDTPDQQGNVTLRSSDANNNSRQQTRPNSNAERDGDNGGADSRRRNDSPPQRFLQGKGRDSYDNRTPREHPLEGDYAGEYPPTPNQHSGSEDGGDDSHYDNRQCRDNNQRQDDYRQYNDNYQRSNNDTRQYQDDNRRHYDDSNLPRDNRNTGSSVTSESKGEGKSKG